MAYNKKSYQKIQEEFAGKSKEKIYEADQRRMLLEKKLPELARINEQLRGTGIKIFSAVAGKADYQKKLEEIRAENEELQARRKEILMANGYPEDYLEPKYDCPICKDTGAVGLKMCSCMKKALVLEGYKNSGMWHLIKQCSFENYDLSHFKADPEMYENMEYIIDVCREYAGSFTTDSDEVAGGAKNLLMFGGTGLGKTHISAAMAKILIDRGYDVLYDTAQNVFYEFEQERFGPDKYSEASRETISRFFECDILIIDDLGTELINQFTRSVLYNLINTRLNHRKAMIFSTNFSLSELRTQYDDRIASRMLGEFRPLRFIGTDYRQLKLQ